MKKRTIFKGLCMAIASAMLAAVMPMAAMAAEGDTITAKFDTYIDNKKPDIDYSGTAAMNFQLRGSNIRKAIVGFDLDELGMQEGQQVESAKISVYLGSYFNYNAPLPEGKSYSYIGSDVSCYVYGTAVDYDKETVTWNSMADNVLSKVATTKLCVNDVLEKGWYEFDITDYLESNQSASGKTLFAIASDLNNTAGGFISDEDSKNNADKSCTAKLTVTYKVAEELFIPAVDSRIITDQATQNNTKLNSYGLRNFGNNYKSVAKFAFDISEIDSMIPEGKVITSADLSFYVQSKSKNSNSALNVENQGIRVVNYEDNYWIDYNVESAADSLVSYTGTDENGEAWVDTAAEDIRVTAGLKVSGIAPLYEGMDIATNVTGAKAVTLEKWFNVDVTEFFAKQKNNEDAFGFISFGLTANTSENGPVYVANKWNVNAPKLVLHLGDASELGELTIGEPSYVSPYDSENTLDTLVAGQYTMAKIPVSGVAEEAVVADVYVAEYDADGALIYVRAAEDYSFWQGNGIIGFNFTPREETRSVKTFIWTGDNTPIVASEAIAVAE